MRSSKGALIVVAIVFAVALGSGFSRTGASAAQLPLDAAHDSGQSVIAAYEGWFKNADGTFSFLIGYFNRNLKQTLDIPIGPDNRVEPGGPDRGQPTHFLPRRQWGVFTITVPADFGQQKLTWTLTANGKTTSIPFALHPDYEVSPMKDPAQGNTPPVLRFEANGPSFQGPPRAIAATFTATAGEPMPLSLWATDDGIVDPDRRATDTPVTITWSHYRGAGTVTFSNARPEVSKADGKASTTVTFSAPGDYVLRAQANDVSGEGGAGFQCCWTNAHVAVAVKSAATTK